MTSNIFRGLILVVFTLSLALFFYQRYSTPSSKDITPVSYAGEPKIFCIGLFKTGTTSIGAALRILGFDTENEFVVRIKPIDSDGFWNVDDSQSFTHRYDAIREFANMHDAFSDSPWIYLYRELDEWFPGSKFILTVRDPEDVADSDIAMTLRQRRTPQKREAYINRYNQHYQNVTEYFKDRPDDLLIHDVRDGWPKLVKFLGKEEPLIRFPHENKNPNKK